MVVDHHEDEMMGQNKDDLEDNHSYGYVYGEEGVIGPICQSITGILKSSGFSGFGGWNDQSG